MTAISDLQAEIAAQNQVFLYRLDSNSVRITAAQQDANTATALAQSSLSQIYQMGLDAEVYTNDQIQYLRDEMVALANQVGQSALIAANLATQTELNKLTPQLQSVLTETVLAINQIAAELGLDLADFNEVTAFLLDDALPALQNTLSKVEQESRENKQRVDAAFAEYNFDTLIEGFDQVTYETVNSILPFRSPILRLPAGQWTTNSASLTFGNKFPPLPEDFLVDDPILEECYRFPAGSPSIGPALAIPFDPEKIYKLELRGRSIDDGTKSASLSFGATAWAAGFQVAGNVHSHPEFVLNESSGDITRVCYVTANAEAAEKLTDSGKLCIDLSDSATNATHCFFHVRQNVDSSRDGRALLGTFEVGEVSETIQAYLLAEKLRTEIDELVDGFLETNLVTAFANLDQELARVDQALATIDEDIDIRIGGLGDQIDEAVDQITGLLPSDFKSGTRYWQSSSTDVEAGPSVDHPVVYDSGLFANAVIMDANNETVAPKDTIQVKSDRVYEIEVQGRVLSIGTRPIDTARIGVYGWDEDGQIVNLNTQKPVQFDVPEGEIFNVSAIYTGVDSVVPAGFGDRTINAGAVRIRPHFRVNTGSAEGCVVRVSRLTIREITGRVKAEYTDARLTQDFYTSEGVNDAIAIARTALQADVDSVSATLAQDYYTAAETDNAVSASRTALKSQLEGPGGSISAAQNAAQNAANLAGAKGRVFFQNSAPTGADRDAKNLWIDTTSSNNTPKRWNGSSWVTVTDKVATNAAAAAAAAQQSVNTVSATLTQDYYTAVETDSAVSAARLELISAINNVKQHNLVGDPSFTQGVNEAWAPSHGATLGTGEATSGSVNPRRIRARDGTDTGQAGVYTLPFLDGSAAGRTYRFTGSVRGSTSNVNTLRVAVVTRYQDSTGYAHWSFAGIINGSWRKFDATVTVPEGINCDQISFRWYFTDGLSNDYMDLSDLVIEDITDSANLRATLTQDYYTATETDNAVSALNTSLRSELSGVKRSAASYQVIMDDVDVGVVGDRVTAQIGGPALGSPTVILTGEPGSLGTGGYTNGYSLEIPKERAIQFAGRKVKISVMARKPATNGAAKFVVAYSTDDNGNSGAMQSEGSLTSEFQWFVFYWDVPNPDAGLADYLGLWGDASQTGKRTEFARVMLEHAVEVTDLPEIGQLSATLDQDYYTAVETDSAVAAAKLALRSEALGYSGSNLLPWVRFEEGLGPWVATSDATITKDTTGINGPTSKSGILITLAAGDGLGNADLGTSFGYPEVRGRTIRVTGLVSSNGTSNMEALVGYTLLADDLSQIDAVYHHIKNIPTSFNFTPFEGVFTVPNLYGATVQRPRLRASNTAPDGNVGMVRFYDLRFEDITEIEDTRVDITATLEQDYYTSVETDNAVSAAKTELRSETLGYMDSNLLTWVRFEDGVGPWYGTSDATLSTNTTGNTGPVNKTGLLVSVAAGDNLANADLSAPMGHRDVRGRTIRVTGWVSSMSTPNTRVEIGYTLEDRDGNYIGTVSHGIATLPSNSAYVAVDGTFTVPNIDEADVQRPRFRVFNDGSSAVGARFNDMRFVDVTEIEEAKVEFDATLTNEYLTETDTNAAIAAARTSLKSELNNGTIKAAQDKANSADNKANAAQNSISSLSATLTNDYYTSVETDSAVAQARLKLLSEIDSARQNNLVGDPMMTGDIDDNWSASINAEISIGGHGSSGPSNPLRIRVRDTTNGQGGVYSLPFLSGSAAGRTYRFTGWVRGPSNASNTLRISVVLGYNGNFQYGYWKNVQTINSGFDKFSGQVTIPEGALSDTIRFRWYFSNGSNNNYMDLADLVVEDITEVARLSATLTQDYLTAAETGQAVTIARNALQSQIDGVSSTVTTQGSTIADLEGNASAGYLIRAQAGNQVSLIDLIAADGSSGSVSIAKIDAQQILLNGSVTAKQLAIGDFENYGGVGDDIESAFNTSAAGNYITTGTIPEHPRHLTINNGNNMYREPIPVAPGDEFYVSMWARITSSYTPDGNSKLRFSTPGGGHLKSLPYGDLPSKNTWYFLEAEFTIPAGESWLDCALWSNYAGGGAAFISQINIRRKRSGKLLVDGSVEARHASFASLAALNLKVGNGDIVGTLQSSGFSSGGASGWRLPPSGSPEFNGVVLSRDMVVDSGRISTSSDNPVWTRTIETDIPITAWSGPRTTYIATASFANLSVRVNSGDRNDAYWGVVCRELIPRTTWYGPHRLWISMYVDQYLVTDLEPATGSQWHVDWKVYKVT